MRRLVIVLNIFLWVILSYAQQDPQYTHFFEVKSGYNPAYLGLDGTVNITLLNRNQWIKFEGAPNTSLITVESPINLFGINSGIGVKLLNDSYGFVQDFLLGLMYAYHKDLINGVLSFGLGINLFSKEFNPQWNFPEQQEPLFEGQSRSMVLDFDGGIVYRADNFILGFSVSHLTAPKFVFISENGNEQLVGLERHYYLFGQYNYIFSNFSLEPAFLVKSDLKVLQVDLNLMLKYNKKVWVGVSYRNKESVIFIAGTSYLRDVKISLSYDVLLNSIGRVSPGTFEVLVGYSFSLLKLEKPHKYHNVKTL